jgi:hydrocephalus-inducing protein
MKTFLMFNVCHLSKFPRRLRLVPPACSWLSIEARNPKLAASKLATGVEVIYKLTFSPDEKKDYAYDLECITERENFIIPVRAVGARGLVNFPDVVHFDRCPVRFRSSKTVFVRNIGEKACRFWATTSEPFSLVPYEGYVRMGEAMQVEFVFDPKVRCFCLDSPWLLLLTSVIVNVIIIIFPKRNCLHASFPKCHLERWFA